MRVYFQKYLIESESSAARLTQITIESVIDPNLEFHMKSWKFVQGFKALQQQ